MQLVPFYPGNYAYLPGGFQYSAAVRADEGFAIERARFLRPVPIAAGFARIFDHLQAIGRPPTALCACELRSPAALDEPAFVAFNRGYIEPLAAKGLFAEERNPVARCNLVPVLDPPPTASFYAFSYTVPGRPAVTPDFATSGAAECPDEPGYRARIVRLGETSPDALVDKLAFAAGDIEGRLGRMALAWRDVAAFNLYSAHDLHAALAPAFGARGVLAGAVGLHLVRPPVIDIEIEIDARRISREILLAA